MGSIETLISELARIRNALGNDLSDPRRRRRYPSAPPREPERIAGDPVLDSPAWQIDDPELWEEKKEAARRGVEGNGVSASKSGIEALAWYVSFHDNQQEWGIYIPLSSLALMDELYLSTLPLQRDARLQLAWSILLLHEQMHFAVDYACAFFELMLRAPMRREFRARFNRKFNEDHPLAAETRSDAYLEIEEAAANGHMLRQIAARKSRVIVQTIENFVGKQPPGYREGLKATADAAFAETISETLRNYLALWTIEHHLDLGSSALNLDRLLPLSDGKILAECPIYVLHNLDEAGIAQDSVRLVHSIREIFETENFARQLCQQEDAIRRDWSRMKEKIKISLPRPPRFEKLRNWQPPTWSLRLRAGHRVHLQLPSLGSTAWRAVAIGNHKEMGHG